MSDNPTLQIADNIVVSMHYNLTVDNEVIDTTDDHEPIQFIQGHGNIIPGLERELMGLKVGESKKIIVQPADAYGEYDANAFTEVNKDQFPPDFEIRLGGELRVRTVSGQFISATIESVVEDTVKLNLNHPLAGKELLFDAKIVDMRAATEEEISNGQLGGCSCSSGGCESGGECGSSEGCNSNGECGSGCC
jgi:FKBP-type peptidyl-prolyl cis-trans isomerase SlyD